ncbi:hypothetical protein [Kineococcus xinjiangensis]|uniref:hypothetical protein n=1 Tax=Kineococcus xinjiangensis TaxID=512762 RepID=UPI000CEC7D83|nr:hypothetical protein [Kineococcus xinjiangensis]
MTPPTSWTWRFEDADGRQVGVEEASAQFPTQADAESWIGETWRSLRERGVDAVRLFADGEQVYGPLSLRTVE